MEPVTEDISDSDAQTPGGVRANGTFPSDEATSTSRRDPPQAQSSEPKMKWNRQRRSNLLRSSLHHFLGAAAPPSPSKSKNKFRLVSQQQILYSEVASVLMSVLAHSPEIRQPPKEQDDKASHVTHHFDSKEESMLRRRSRWERRKDFLALDTFKWNEIETSVAPDAENTLRIDEEPQEAQSEQEHRRGIYYSTLASKTFNRLSAKFNFWRSRARMTKCMSSEDGIVEGWARALRKKGSERHHDDIRFLMEFVNEFSFLSDAPQNQREAMCRILKLRWISPEQGETDLFAPGDDATQFYMILYGEVSIWLYENSYDAEGCRNRKPVVMLQEGDCFGEMALLTHGVRRAGATTYGGTVLVIISKEDFQKTVLNLNERVMRERLDFMCRIPILSTASLHSLREAVALVDQAHFSQGEVLLYEQAVTGSFYFIVKGRVRMVAFTEGRENEKTEPLTMGELGPGHFIGLQAVMLRKPQQFSYICMAACTILTVKNDFLSRLDVGTLKYIEHECLRSYIDSPGQYIEGKLAQDECWKYMKEFVSDSVQLLDEQKLQSARWNKTIGPLGPWPLQAEWPGLAAEPAKVSDDAGVQFLHGNETYLNHLEQAVVLVAILEDPHIAMRTVHLDLLNDVYQRWSAELHILKMTSVRYTSNIFLAIASPWDVKGSGQSIAKLTQELMRFYKGMVEHLEEIRLSLLAKSAYSANVVKSDHSSEKKDKTMKRYANAQTTARMSVCVSMLKPLGSDVTLSPLLRTGMAIGQCFIEFSHRGAFVVSVIGDSIDEAWSMVEEMRVNDFTMAARTPEMQFPSFKMHVGPEVRVYLTSEWELSPYCPSSKLLDSDQQEIYASNMKAMLPAIMQSLHRVRPRARHLQDTWKVEGQRSASWLSILPKLAIPPGTSVTQEALQRSPACQPASKLARLPASSAAATTSTVMSKSPQGEKAVKRLTRLGYPLKRTHLPSDPPCHTRAEESSTLQPPTAPLLLGEAVQIQPGKTRVHLVPVKRHQPKPHRHLSSRRFGPMAKVEPGSIGHLDGLWVERPCEKLPISSCTVPHPPSSLQPSGGSVPAMHRQLHRGRKLSQQQLDPSVHESGAVTHR